MKTWTDGSQALERSSVNQTTLVKFSAIQVGDYFLDDGIMNEKIRDASESDTGLARGPKRRPLGTGAYDFHADDEVERL